MTIHGQHHGQWTILSACNYIVLFTGSMYGGLQVFSSPMMVSLVALIIASFNLSHVSIT